MQLFKIAAKGANKLPSCIQSRTWPNDSLIWQPWWRSSIIINCRQLHSLSHHHHHHNHQQQQQKQQTENPTKFDPDHRRFLDASAVQLGIQKPDDWYKFTAKHIEQLEGGYQFLRANYDSSLQQALAAAYPEFEWIPWRFQQTPRRFWDDPANHRRFFDWAAKELGIARWEDWYAVTASQIQKLGGGGLLKKHYMDSLSRALAAVYPEREWLPWRFIHIPNKLWTSDPDSFRRFFQWAEGELGIHKPEDWYSVSLEQINEMGGAALIRLRFGGSLQKALAALYPEYEWLPWRFKGVPLGFWKHAENQRRFMEWAARQLGVRALEDWYRVSLDDVVKLGGGGLLNSYHGGSLKAALASIYPDYEWLPWRFHTVSQHYWDDPANHRRFFDWVAKQLHIEPASSPEGGWYDAIDTEIVEKLGGKSLLESRYGNSLPRALASVYPESEWEPWRFSRMRSKVSHSLLGFWKHNNDVATHRRFLDWAAQQMQHASMEDWYHANKPHQVHKLGGAGLLFFHYDGSLYKALATVYPEHQWQLWRFHQQQRSLMDVNVDEADELLRQYVVEYLARELHIEHLDDWYRVSVSHLRRRLGGGGGGGGGYHNGIIEHFGGLAVVLRKVYPQHPWDEKRLIQKRGARHTSKKSSQRMLFISLRKLFP